MVALFFRPEDLYEWIVYDELKKQKGEDVEILMAKLGETKESYFLKSKTNSYERFSEPDFIIVENDLISVVDAKWKILKTPTDIKFDDIAKLKRDIDIRKDSFDGKECRGVLVYPKIEFDAKMENPFSFDYEDIIEFRIGEISIRK